MISQLLKAELSSTMHVTEPACFAEPLSNPTHLLHFCHCLRQAWRVSTSLTCKHGSTANGEQTQNLMVASVKHFVAVCLCLLPFSSCRVEGENPATEHVVSTCARYDSITLKHIIYIYTVYMLLILQEQVAVMNSSSNLQSFTRTNAS